MKSTLILAGMIAANSIRYVADKGASAGTAEGEAPKQPYVLPPTPPVVETTSVELKKIVIDAGTQPRVAIDDEVVKEYAEVIKECIKNEQPIPFPPVTGFRDATGRVVLADGFHRYAAHKLAHAKEIDMELREGDERAALLYSLSANQTHGVRRTNKDKQRAMKIAFADPELSTLGNSELARFIGVSEFAVRDNRPAKSASSTRSVVIRGKKTTMNVAAIGKGKGGGKKGAKAAKKAAKGGKAAPAKGGKSTAVEDAAKELDKMLVKIADNVGAPDGGKFRAGVLDGSLSHVSIRDVRDMTTMAPAKQRAIMPLIIGGLRMKPSKAFEFIGSDLPEKIQSELHNRAIGTPDGKYTFEGEGFTVVVTLNKKK